MALAVILHGCADPDPHPGAASAAVADCETDSGAPGPTWAGWGQPFFSTWCQPCHAADTPQRYGAPAGVTFDSEAEARAQAAAIRASVLDQERMPVGGGLSEGDRARLAAWLCDVERP